MGSSLVRALLGAVAGIFVTFASYAQEGILTPSVVGSFIASYPQVKATADELTEQYDLPGGSSASDAWRAWTAVDGARNQLDAVVQAHGFQDFANWVRVLSVTAQAYAFAEDGQGLDDRMSEALARIENDPDISESQKEMMRQQLQHSAAAIAAIKPSQGDIDAVTPHVDQLRELFGDEG